MLNIDNPVTGPVTLHVSFLQCVKMGAGFSFGATLITFFALFATVMVYGSLFGLIARLAAVR